MEIQQRINQQRVKHIVDSYRLTGDEVDAFDTYFSELLSQYPQGLIELALVDTLAKSWLTVPMQKGVPFLAIAHNRIKQWQQEEVTRLADMPLSYDLTPSQFSQITGLDPSPAFCSLTQPIALSTQPAIE